MDRNFYITIGRQLGSGGRAIGEKLAARLGIAFYDKELIYLASQKSGIGKEFFEKIDEKETHSLFPSFFGVRTPLIDDQYSSYYLSNETLFKIQSDVIRGLAEQQSCIFVGRCADYVLKDRPAGLNVFISANKEDRIRRVALLQGLSEQKAKDFLEKIDKKRAAYYNYYSDKTWGAAVSYHLCVNSSIIGIDETVAFIRRFAERRFGLGS